MKTETIYNLNKKKEIRRNYVLIKYNKHSIVYYYFHYYPIHAM